MESAFNSEENLQWAKYKFHLGQPQVSERSGENHLLFPAPDEDEVGSEADSGSSFSSKYSDHEEPGERKKEIVIEESPETPEITAAELSKKIERIKIMKQKMRLSNLEMKKQQDLTFFKTVNGLNLPMKNGDREKKYDVGDMLEISKRQMQIHKL